MAIKAGKLLSLLAACGLLLTLAACGGAEKPAVSPTAAPTAEPTAEPAPEPTAEPTEEPAAEPTPEPEETSYLDISGVDFSAPDVTIAYDNYDGMYKLADDMQNFRIPADTVVEIDGEVGSSMLSHTIVIPNAEGDMRAGTTYEVVGGDVEFPPDGTRIHIVGVVRMNEYDYNVLVVPAALFTVVEEG